MASTWLLLFSKSYRHEGPSTNIMRTLGVYMTNDYYGLGQVLLICGLGPSGHISHFSLGKGSQDSPIRTIRDYY